MDYKFWLRLARLMPRKLRRWVFIDMVADYSTRNPNLEVPAIPAMDILK
jgi:hypothetical protein